MTGKERKKEKTAAGDPPRGCTGLVSFGLDARRLLNPLLGKKGFIQADILSHWEDILGRALSAGVTPASVSFSKTSPDRAVLHVKAFSGAYAVEFNARKEQILEKINSYFGYPAVADIRLTQGGAAPRFSSPAPFRPPEPREQAEINALTSDIEDEALRNAAAELGLLLHTSKK